MRLGVLFLVGVVGCSSSWEEVGEPWTQPDDTATNYDIDGDGYTLDRDCDDEDPEVHANADEVCDGKDNDCNGLVDDDASDAAPWTPDADDDTYGDAGGTVVVACDAPEGYVADATDCDDTTAAVHPGATEDDCLDPVDYNCDGSTGYADDDADGFAACEDCDDQSGAVNPAATEVCDDVDNDCSGAVDDGAIDATAWYRDADGDAYGTPDDTQTACDAPEGYVAAAEDCDDADAAFNPGADEACDDPADYNCDGSVAYADADGDGWAACEECDDADADVRPDGEELCNGTDDDCDGTVDEDDAGDAATWYLDVDGDGYGVATTTTVACAQPTGYAALADDCDDADTLFHPGADEADCDDPNDYNCDGSVAYADTDGDGYAACEECDDNDAAVNPAAIEVCNDVDDDCDATTDEPDATDAGTWYADSDGDTYGDAGVTTIACDAPAAYVADDTDCDDTLASTFPGADETCDGADDDCDGTVDEPDAVDAATWYTDADGDGWGLSTSATVACDAPVATDVNVSGDCDDGAATVHPSATETCNDVDDDCDATIDEPDAVGAGTWYTDADVDGFGDATTGTVACDAPAGAVADDTDCDDGDGDTHPGADEYCDGADDDCDGTVDEDDAVDAGSWYADDDEDGFGDATDGAVACDAPLGFVADDSDCDDADAVEYPGADEACDGDDDDCDGLTDESDAVDASTWYADADSDGFGDAGTTQDACEVPGGYVADATDCDDAHAAAFPGGAEVCDDLDNDCDGAVDVGASDPSTWYADVDGDGYGDASSTAEGCDAPANHVATGTDCDDTEAASFPGNTETCNDGIDNDCDPDPSVCRYAGSESLTQGARVYGATASDYLGSSVAGAGDVDGDGIDDVLVGAMGVDDVASAAGALYVFRGPLATGTASLSSAYATVLGTRTNELLGNSTAFVPDMDGDGDDEVLIGATGGYGTANTSGLAYLLEDPLGSTSASTAGVTITCNTKDDACGAAVAGVRDLDGDGLGDVVVSASGEDPSSKSAAGAVGLFWATDATGTHALSSASIYVTGAAASDSLGSALDAVGDLDGDGLDDVVLGAYGYDGGATDAGGVFVILGASQGSAATSFAATSADGVVTGATAEDRFGVSVSRAGDTDGDGYAEFAVGADYSDLGAGDAGAVYLFEGLADGAAAAEAFAVLTGAAASDYAGRTVNGPGDVDDDGFDDLVVGATAVDTGANGGGAAYLFYGPVASGSVSDADASWLGSSNNEAVGYRLGVAGDLDDDGVNDLLFGVIANDGAATNGGGAFMLPGTTE